MLYVCVVDRPWFLSIFYFFVFLCDLWFFFDFFFFCVNLIFFDLGEGYQFFYFFIKICSWSECHWTLCCRKWCKKPWKMLETLARVYSSESTQRGLFHEYQHDRVLDVFQKSLHLCALDESSLSILRVKSIRTALIQLRAISFLWTRTCDWLIKARIRWPTLHGSCSHFIINSRKLSRPRNFFINAVITLPMLSLLSFKAQIGKDFWNPSKPCHVVLFGKL